MRSFCAHRFNRPAARQALIQTMAVYSVTISEYPGNRYETLLLTRDLSEANEFAKSHAYFMQGSADFEEFTNSEGGYQASCVDEMGSIGAQLIGVKKNLPNHASDHDFRKASPEVLRAFCGVDKLPNLGKGLSKADLVLYAYGLLNDQSIAETQRQVEEAREKKDAVVDRVVFLGRTVRATASCIITGEKFYKGELRVGFLVQSNYDQWKMQPKWCKTRAFFKLSPSTLAEFVDKQRLKIKERVRVLLPATLEELLDPSSSSSSSSSYPEGGKVTLSETEREKLTRRYSTLAAAHPSLLCCQPGAAKQPLSGVDECAAAGQKRQVADENEVQQCASKKLKADDV